MLLTKSVQAAKEIDLKSIVYIELFMFHFSGKKNKLKTILIYILVIKTRPKLLKDQKNYLKLKLMD